MCTMDPTPSSYPKMSAFLCLISGYPLSTVAVLTDLIGMGLCRYPQQ